MIVLSIATFGVYVAIFVAVVAAVVWWLASMFGLIIGNFGKEDVFALSVRSPSP